MGGRGEVNYRNPCLTMHQPWASLLVHGIKRIEGRSWPAPLRGRLWIHAASKVPDQETIKAMEDFYRAIYGVNGIEDLKFPENYPTSRLLGCVDVVGCVKREELECWNEVPDGVRLEAQTDLCWLCENPQKLLVPFEMRGFQGVYNLERRIYEAAVRGLIPVEAPLPVKFPLPDSRNPFSLKPGSLAFSALKVSDVQKPEGLTAAIAGARAAATQFSKQVQKYPATNAIQQKYIMNSKAKSQLKDKSTEEEECERPEAVLGQPHKKGNSAQKYKQNSKMVSEGNGSSRCFQDPNKKLNNQSHNKSIEESKRPFGISDGHRPHQIGNSAHGYREKSGQMVYERSSSSRAQAPPRDLNLNAGAPKILAAALKGLRPS